MTGRRAPLSRGAGVLIAVVALLGIVVLATRAVLAPMSTRTPPPSPAATTAFPSAEPSFDLQTPLTSTEVSDGHRVSIDGQGKRQVAYRIAGAGPVVARLDCSRCQGMGSFVWGDDPRPLFSGIAPYLGEHLLNVDPARRQGLLIVDAVGAWKLSLATVADLPVRKGRVAGSGPAVVSLGGPGAGVSASLAAAPAATRVSLNGLDGRVLAERTGPAASRWEATLGGTLPALVVIETRGEWAIVPTG